MNSGGRPTRVLVTGGRGQLGRELEDLLRRHGIPCDAPGHDQLDVTDFDEMDRYVHRAQPGLVIHTAAWTDVDGCEHDPYRARRVNTEATAHLAQVCAERGIFLAYLSTDFVFDGTKRTPYEPDDPPNPLSVYGRTKWEGEVAVRDAGGAFAIVRTSWVYGVHGRNFPKSILRAAAERRKGSSNEPLRVVTDQVGSPTHAADLAWALLQLLGLGQASGVSPSPSGTFHAANHGHCSWNAFAKEILRQAGWDVPVEPICSEDLGRPAPRPAYSVLDLGSLDAQGIRMRPWEEALSHFLRDLRLIEPGLFP